jgi:hypothetical protein
MKPQPRTGCAPSLPGGACRFAGFARLLGDYRFMPRASVRCVPIALDCRMGTLVPCRVIILPGLIRKFS